MQAVTAQGATLRGSTLTREALAASGGAAILSALLVWMGPPGSDLAAHVYQRAVYLQHGFTLWNNFWYAGRYSFVTYSLIYYPLAALRSASGCWRWRRSRRRRSRSRVVVLRQWGVEARWSSRTFAVVWAGIVAVRGVPVRARRGARAARARRAAARGTLAVRGARGADRGREPARLPAAGARGRSGLAIGRRDRPAELVAPARGRRGRARRGRCSGGSSRTTGDYPFSAGELLARARLLRLRDRPDLAGRAARAAAGSSSRSTPSAASLAFFVPSALGENVAPAALRAVPLAVLVC